MATSAWGKPTGAWAAAVEDEEKEHGPIAPPTAAAPEDDFPTLGVAATVKETKKDKKKKQTMSLGDFMRGGGASAGGRAADVDVLQLPTAPRQRAEGEERPERGLGGAFGGYGGREGGRPRYGDRERDDEERGPRREREDMGPSRADMASDWGAERKFTPSEPGGGRGFGGGGFGGGGFRDREGGSFRDRDGSRDRRGYEEGPSRADTAGDWGANKAFVPSSSGRGYEDRGRGGFDDRDRRPGFREGSRDREGGYREPSRADVEDRWAHRGGDAKPTGFDDRPRREFDDERGPPRHGFGDRWGEPRSRDGSQDRWARGGPPPGEDSPPRERPRLNLAPRTATAAAPPAPAVGANRSSVFGAARPREEVLKEQGRDAIKEEEEREQHHREEEEAVLAARERGRGRELERGAPPPPTGPPVERPESLEEKKLKQQIVDLQVRVAAGEGDAQADEEDEREGEGPAGKGRTVAAALQQLEEQLRRLQLDLDAKARDEQAVGEGGRSNGGGGGLDGASSWRRSSPALPQRGGGGWPSREGGARGAEGRESFRSRGSSQDRRDGYDRKDAERREGPPRGGSSFRRDRDASYERPPRREGSGW
eukprot:scaffold6.g2638.t1